MALDRINEIRKIAPVGPAQPAQSAGVTAEAPLDSYGRAGGIALAGRGPLASGLWSSAPKGPGAEILTRTRVSTIENLERNRTGIVSEIEKMARSSREVN